MEANQPRMLAGVKGGGGVRFPGACVVLRFTYCRMEEIASPSFGSTFWILSRLGMVTAIGNRSYEVEAQIDFRFGVRARLLHRVLVLAAEDRDRLQPQDFAVAVFFRDGHAPLRPVRAVLRAVHHQDDIPRVRAVASFLMQPVQRS